MSNLFLTNVHQRELRDITDNPPEGATAAPIDPDYIHHWHGSIEGPVLLNSL